MPSDAPSSAQRDFDLVVFGATGFTGKFIASRIAETIDSLSGGAGTRRRWAVAGRSEQRLRALVGDLRVEQGKSGSGEPETVIANAQDPASLAAMCRRAKVVVNAVGPFRFFGEPVVKACIEQGADYVDITGEPEFFERMHHIYHEQAQKAGVMIVHCCGFDSVPADLSVLYAKRQIQAKGAVPSSIEMYFQIKTSVPQGFGGNYATYESAVYGIGNADELRKLRKQMTRPHLQQVGPRLKLKGVTAWDDRVQSWIVPFFFADPSVIRLSQCLEAELGPSCSSDGKAVPPVQFAGYIQINSFLYLWLLVIFTAVFAFLATKPWGRDLLLKHPKLFSYGIFSRDGPSEEQIRGTRFISRFFAAGYSSEEGAASGGEPDVHMVIECTGPEPGYVTTPICTVNCAYAILRAKETLQLPKGVLTPAVAFGTTDLIERLTHDGVCFSVVG